VIQVFSLVGALLILVAFAAAQFRKLTPEHVSYNLMNFVGSAILAYVALFPLNFGFLLLESVWALVSLLGLFRSLRPHAAAS
jgi:hypothetical protein